MKVFPERFPERTTTLTVEPAPSRNPCTCGHRDGRTRTGDPSLPKRTQPHHTPPREPAQTHGNPHESGSLGRSRTVADTATDGAAGNESSRDVLARDLLAGEKSWADWWRAWAVQAVA